MIENQWKATVTLTNEQVTPITFESFDTMMCWMKEHYGEYTAFIAAEKEGESNPNEIH